MQKSKVKIQNCNSKLKILVIAIFTLCSLLYVLCSFAGDRGNPPPKIAFVKNGNIWIMDHDGKNQKQLTNTGKDGSPAWSPNRGKITFESERDGSSEIYVMGSDGKNQTRLTENNAGDTSPTWSPDGKKIVFQSYRDGNYEIYVMDSDGRNQTRLTENNTTDYSPTWSPDGEKIAFVSGRDGNNEIYVMDFDGKNQTRLTENNTRDENPTWSPNGKKIAFTSGTLFGSAFGGSSNNEIYIMDKDGKNQMRLTKNTVSDLHPTWSPDSRKIAFESTRGSKSEIYVMDSDGKNKKKLADGRSPVWSR